MIPDGFDSPGRGATMITDGQAGGLPPGAHAGLVDRDTHASIRLIVAKQFTVAPSNSASDTMSALSR